MAKNAACQTFIPMLSPFIDGELTPQDRVSVERHLSACKACTAYAADLRAESGLMRVGLEMLADEVDFRDFAQKVLARVTPERPPLFERIKLSLSEMFLYQRGPMVAALASAAAMLLLGLPLLLRDGRPLGYAGERLEVQAVKVEQSAHVAPVVMETESGDTIIWTVEHNHGAGADRLEESEELELDSDAAKPLPEARKPEGGEL